MLATSLFPIIGEAVRKAVAHALQGMFDSLNLMLDRGLSLESWRWRFEAWRTGRSFGEVALTRSLNYRVEQVFLIHRETGLLLRHVAFESGIVRGRRPDLRHADRHPGLRPRLLQCPQG